MSSETYVQSANYVIAPCTL